MSALQIPPALLAGRALTPQPEATTLVLAERHADGRELLLTPPAAAAWQRLKAAAAADGLALVLVSAFRSVARQTEIIQRHLAEGRALDQVLQAVAPPGYSEHHSGRAVDIGTAASEALEIEFELTPAFAWLQQHAAAHGFTLSYPRGNAAGFQYEPWHWCWQPDTVQAPPATV